MAKGIFLHRSDTRYQDVPSSHYQFPKQYKGRVDQCVGDWIIFLEPSKVPETRGYFAIAKVERVIDDPAHEGMFIALMQRDTYLDFGEPVPFNGEFGIVEKSVLNETDRISGRAQSAVRVVPIEDFVRIAELGLRDEDALPRIDDRSSEFELQEASANFEFDMPPDRRVIESFTSRKVRDRSFRKVILSAYGKRCAMTGLKLINGGGRAEVEAAHIRPVEENGPDIVNNGIALSGTVHWMFDRGLLSVSDNYEILMSRQINDRDAVVGLLNNDQTLRVPARIQQRPHPKFLKWHRENCFKQ